MYKETAIEIRTIEGKRQKTTEQSDRDIKRLRQKIYKMRQQQRSKQFKDKDRDLTEERHRDNKRLRYRYRQNN